MIFGFLLTYGLAILLCWHIVRTGRDTFWIWIVLMAPVIGSLAYIALNIVPEIFGGATARRFSRSAREALDPHREYREAKAACEETPTVRNQSRLAAAAMHMGRPDEAEALYRAAAQGIHVEDPVLLLGLANALLELNRPAQALEALERLDRSKEGAHSPQAALALGRAYEGVGRLAEADAAYDWAAQRAPGFEGLARYAAFMARHGRRDEAKEVVQELDKRLSKLRPQYRKEGRAWRDLAARALASG